MIRIRLDGAMLGWKDEHLPDGTPVRVMCAIDPQSGVMVELPFVPEGVAAAVEGLTTDLPTLEARQQILRGAGGFPPNGNGG